MKKLIIILFAVLTTTSCVTSYYQVYKVIPTSKLASNAKSLVFEDGNCRIDYNFWNEGGDIGFTFYNKTSDNIFLSLDESYFILNGVAFDYYKNRVFTYTSSTGFNTGFRYTNINAGVQNSSSYAISYNEDKVICIPPMTSKVIKEFTINQSFISSCNVFKYPSSRQVKSLTFKQNDSPLVFSNILQYSVGISQQKIKITNGFYVSEITNYPENDIVKTYYDEPCGKKTMIEKKTLQGISPDKFYIKYMKGTDTSSH